MANLEAPKQEVNKAVWFSGPKRFSSFDSLGNIELHPFFDYETTIQKMTVKVVLTTPFESRSDYDLHIPSGKLYKRRYYCEQNDVWKKFDDSLDFPNFAEAFIPRTLDQLGDPQKVIVFGEKEKFPTQSFNSPVLFDVRIVGGVVEQYCRQFPCNKRDEWLSRLILIGVNSKDSDFSEVKNLSQLKDKVDWDYTKAFLENGKGRSIEIDRQLPSYRVTGNIKPEAALKFVVERGFRFTSEGMNNLRQTCRKLYDYMWTQQKTIRNYSPEVGNDVSANEINKKIYTSKRNRTDLDKKDESFLSFLNIFFDKYGERYRTCLKYVRPSNLSSGTDRHWFFAFFEAYARAEERGFIYRCSRRNWIENPRQASGERVYNPNRERRKCLESEFDRAFEKAPGVHAQLKSSDKEHYHYIEYDEGLGGSHQKIYSWVYDNGKRLACSDEKIKKKTRLVFPQDVNWTPFYKKAKGEDRFLIR